MDRIQIGCVEHPQDSRMTTKMTTLRQRQHEATAEAMLDAAERAMVRRGYEQATMQQIAAETGCAPGTFYLYFKNKQVLLDAIVRRHMKAMLQAARPAMEPAKSPLEKVRRAMSEALRYWQPRGEVMRLVFQAWPMRHRAIQDRLLEMGWNEHEEFRREIKGHLQDAQKQGLVRRDVSADILMEFLDAVSFNLAETFSLSPRPKAVEEKIRVLWGLLTGGLLHQEQS
jgi:AcrR family transcriptional regulator